MNQTHDTGSDNNLHRAALLKRGFSIVTIKLDMTRVSLSCDDITTTLLSSGAVDRVSWSCDGFFKEIR